MASQDVAWSAGAAAVGVTLCFALIRAVASRGRFPRLTEPGGPEPGRSERARYYAAIALALLAGVVAGLLLWCVPASSEPSALFHHTMYGDAGGRLLGPLLTGLAVPALTALPLCRRLAGPQAMQHILWRSAARMDRADPRPLLKWAGVLVGAAALLLHFGLRMEYTTFDGTGIRWRDLPWQGERVQTWQAVTDVRIVQQWVAASGTVRERPHLSIEFGDGSVLRCGRRDEVPAGYWELPAQLASERSGVPVNRVLRED